MDVKIEEGWKNLLEEEFSKPYFDNLVSFVRSEYQNQKVYPRGKEIFNAFDHCPLDKLKGSHFRSGSISWSGSGAWPFFFCAKRNSFPPSLLNIFKEINRDLGNSMPANGDLSKWADQGVLLLNATLTVRAHQAGSHQNQGWETFTDAVIQKIAEKKEHVVFMLWGAYAQKKGAFIEEGKHLKLHAPHPSPLSAHRGFLGCGHFSKANDYLRENGVGEIVW
jgi:uracil-DNA glycosylase